MYKYKPYKGVNFDAQKANMKASTECVEHKTRQLILLLLPLTE